MTDREDGAVAVTTALILVVLILLAGFLVDLGSTRADARTDQLLADSAVLAGAAQQGDIHAQCNAALAYLAANVGAGPISPTDNTCDDLPLACDPDLPTPPTPTAPMTIGPYTVVVWHPVADGDNAMTVQGQGITERDGDLCDRMKVVVSRERNFTFGDAGGAADSGSSVNDAVARRYIELGDEEFATLIVLDRTNCRALEVQGGSKALVEDHLDHPGLITVDSDGTGSGCSGGNGYVMIVNGTNDRICAGVDPGAIDGITNDGDLCGDPADGNPRIFTPARATESETLAFGRAANPSDVVVTADPPMGRIRPVPVDSDRSTRLPADATWNCLDSYGKATASEPWLPAEELPGGCDDGHDPYIEETASALGNSADSSFLSDGTWDFSHSGSKCDLSGSVGSPSRNLYLDCATVNVTGDVQLHAKDFIVVRGTMNVSGSLVVDTGDDAVMVFQDGAFTTSSNSARVKLVNTTVYIHQPSFSGVNPLDISLDKTCKSGGPEPNCTEFPVEWSAPQGPAYDDPDDAAVVGECVKLVAEDLPSPECFHKLALWSNASDRHILKGLMDVAGVFFTPNAGRDDSIPFDLAGGATQPMHHAQFFSYRLRISGGSAVLMKPDPKNIIPSREVVASLIR